MSVEDPGLEPARITEGILPLWLNRCSFYVAGGTWAKYVAAGLLELKPEPIDKIHDVGHFAYCSQGDTLSEVD